MMLLEGNYNDVRRGYSRGEFSADQYRAAIGRQDAGARQTFARETGRMQLMEDRRRADEVERTRRMAIQADAMKPVSLGSGMGVQMRPDGTLNIIRPLATAASPEPKTFESGGRTWAWSPGMSQAMPITPAAPQEPKIVTPPGGGIYAVNGQQAMPLLEPPPPENKGEAEPYLGPQFFDQQSGQLLEWNPRGGRYGRGGYDRKPVNAGIEVMSQTGEPVKIGGSSINPRGIPPPPPELSSQPAQAAQPVAQAQAKPLDQDMARTFLRQAGGDRAKARELARAQGYTF